MLTIVLNEIESAVLATLRIGGSRPGRQFLFL